MSRKKEPLPALLAPLDATASSQGKSVKTRAVTGFALPVVTGTLAKHNRPAPLRAQQGGIALLGLVSNAPNALLARMEVVKASKPPSAPGRAQEHRREVGIATRAEVGAHLHPLCPTMRQHLLLLDPLQARLP